MNSLLTYNSTKSGNLPQGVRKHRGKYQAQYTNNGVNTGIGTFLTPEKASHAYVDKKVWYIKSKRDEIELVAKHNRLTVSLTDIVLENFLKQVGVV